jgi:hypothetical protein
MDKIHHWMERAWSLARNDLSQDGYSSCWAREFYDDFAAIIRHPELWHDFQNNGINEGMGGPPFVGGNPREQLLKQPLQQRQLLEAYHDICALIGEEFVNGLLFEGAGRPLGIRHKGKFLNMTDLRNIWAARKVLKSTVFNRNGHYIFVDIGGGYGGMVEKLARLFPKARFILFDLLEGCAIQTYYLANSFPETSIFTYEHFKSQGIGAFLGGKERFAVLPGETIGSLPAETVDLFINMDSMMEMEYRTIQTYFDAIHCALKPGGAFYNSNRYHKPDVGENIEIKRYPYDDRWYFTLSETKWRQPHLHVLTAIRTALPNAHPPGQVMAAYLPYRLADVASDLSAAVSKLGRIVLGAGISTGNPGLWAVLQGKGEMAADPLRKLRRSVANAIRRR